MSYRSVLCEKVAEENCAFSGHETRNIVCCAKHFEEVPCGTCIEEKEAAKQTTQSAKDASTVTEEAK